MTAKKKRRKPAGKAATQYQSVYATSDYWVLVVPYQGALTYGITNRSTGVIEGYIQTLPAAKYMAHKLTNQLLHGYVEQVMFDGDVDEPSFYFRPERKYEPGKPGTAN